jgi:hypothetical protein
VNIAVGGSATSVLDLLGSSCGVMAARAHCAPTVDGLIAGGLETSSISKRCLHGLRRYGSWCRSAADCLERTAQ